MLTIIRLLHRKPILCFPLCLLYIFIDWVLIPLQIEVLKFHDMLALDFFLDSIVSIWLVPKTVTLLEEFLLWSQEIFPNRIILLIECLFEHLLLVDHL